MSQQSSGSQFKFVPARKLKSKLRMAIVGPSGCGKTWTALEIGTRIAALEGGKLAFLDTEGGSARKYAHAFDFDILTLIGNYNPAFYVQAIQAAVDAGYKAIVIDSFSHAWNASGGVLEIVDQSAQKDKGGNKWAGWAEGRPAQNKMVTALIGAPIHIIGTMRAKTEWVQEPGRNGKLQPKKVGLGAVQSEEFEYEFDIVGMMDMEHGLVVSKSRYSELHAGETVDMTDEPTLDTLTQGVHLWLTDGDATADDGVFAPPATPPLPSNAKPFPGTTSPTDTVPQAWYIQKKVDFLAALVTDSVGKTPAEAEAEALRLTGHATWEAFGKAYPTGKDAASAIKTALAAEMGALPPAKPQGDQPAPAAPKPFSWNEDTLADLDTFTQRHLGMTAAETKLNLMQTEWTIHPSMAAAQTAIRVKANDVQAPVYAHELTSRPLGKGVETVFKTLVGDIIMRGGRADIKKLLGKVGEDYAALVGMDKWEKGKGTYSLEQNPLKVVWEVKEGLNQVIGLTPKHPIELPEPAGLDDVPQFTRPDEAPIEGVPEVDPEAAALSDIPF